MVRTVRDSHTPWCKPFEGTLAIAGCDPLGPKKRVILDGEARELREVAEPFRWHDIQLEAPGKDVLTGDEKPNHNFNLIDFTVYIKQYRVFCI